MRKSIIILTAAILLLAATSAQPGSLGYLMVSGGSNPEEASFASGTDVLLLPFPDYMPGMVLELALSDVPGFPGAWVGASKVWFLGALFPEFAVKEAEETSSDLDGIEFPIGTGLYLSHDLPEDIDPADKAALLAALAEILEYDLGRGEGEVFTPFSLQMTEGDFPYREFFGGVEGLSFTESVQVTLGGLVLSKSASAPSTEVDIFEHSPGSGYPIFLTFEVDSATGSITGLRAYVTPEPGALVLMGAGLLCLGGIVRRKRRAA